MRLRCLTNNRHRGNEHHATVENVCSCCEEQDNDYRRKKPVDDEREEGQLEDVEADV